MNIKVITEKTLKLGSALRAYIAEILLESSDYEEDFLVSEPWQQEIKKRCDESNADPSTLIEGESFMAELRQRY